MRYKNFIKINKISLGKSISNIFQNLTNQCEPLEGTDGGVLIQRSTLWDEPGHGETIGAICDRFDKINPELSG